MKIKDTFIVHETGEVTMLVPTGAASFKGIVRGNKILGMILSRLQNDITEEALVEDLKKQFSDAPAGAIERDVAKALGELRKIGALDE